MDLIEQAAKRLEKLREAGVEVAGGPSGTSSFPTHSGDKVLPADAGGGALPESEMLSTGSRLVEIDVDALGRAGFASPRSPQTKIAHEYRVIKRPLIANAMGKGVPAIPSGNLIMVTSALPGEGKTFTAINLAMSIAMELDYTVMLVDADVSKPSVLKVLGLPPSRGLLDVLLDDSVELSDVLLKTNIEKLRVLPSGSPHERATELLASDAMNKLLADMSKRYRDRIIIFDSPPLLVTTESRALAAHMGQIVVVVQADKTTRAELQHALLTIDSCPARMLVLNQARNVGTDRAYGYGFGYGDVA